MNHEHVDMNKEIASLVKVTDAILRGEFNTDLVDIDAEGVLKELTKKINTMVVNLQSIKIPLSSAGDQAPNLVDKALNIVDLMKKTAGEVLDKSDSLSDLSEKLEKKIAEINIENPQSQQNLQEVIDDIKNDIFDIIATQTFQDVARQKMEAMIKDMNQMRDWLVEALVVLQIRKDNSPENIQKQTELLRDVVKPDTTETDKQDLVDDLLAEFGF